MSTVSVAPPERRSLGRILRNYSLALLIFAGAVGLRFLLDYLVPGRLPFITFFPAVMLTAYLCGLWPSIAVLVLSAWFGTVWADPSGTGPIEFYITTSLLFGALGGVIIALVHSLRSSLKRLRQRDEQLAIINRELKHRIKNLFTIANSVCLQTLKSGKSLEEMSDSVSGRILAIAAAQDLLSTTATSGADLHELVAALAGTLAPEASRLEVDGPKMTLSAEATTPFALVLHELGTNALKYGAWSNERGRVATRWSVEEMLHFVWQERGCADVAPPNHDGLGTNLIKNSLPGATVSFDLKGDGLNCQIRLPLEG